MGWLGYALLSAVCAGLVAIFGKIGVREVDSNLATAVRSAVMTVFLIAIITVQGTTGKLSAIPKIPLLFIILSGVAGAVSWIFYFKALQLGAAAQVAAIDKLSVAFAVILAAIFLKESMNIRLIAGVLLILTGAILISRS